MTNGLFLVFHDAAIRLLMEEKIPHSEKTLKVIGNYLFSEQIPMRDEVIGAIKERPSLKDRCSIAERITARILEFMETFISGMVER